jgi:hypothetical protein
MWLTGRLVPDHKTIADFRKDNSRAILRYAADLLCCAAHWDYSRTPALRLMAASSRR